MLSSFACFRTDKLYGATCPGSGQANGRTTYPYRIVVLGDQRETIVASAAADTVIYVIHHQEMHYEGACLESRDTVPCSAGVKAGADREGQEAL
ncbi:hypothetical protein AK812_SmicGene43865 [Symbiodinium microadriaticum]|uniref:Uncharacterized protein n=1 Tax=Symbiodinium microadriaticum TaxID=2951 RepID=A0A1Q9BZX6_SYMMI|nr:hypothetical protein AK812_SmicGene43865 [Symbiodinium microadriaticum]